MNTVSRALIVVPFLSTLFACAAPTSGSSSSTNDLVRVDTAALAAMPAGQSFAIDLRREHVVFEVDGAARPSDLARAVVTSPDGRTDTLDVVVGALHTPATELAHVRLAHDSATLAGYGPSTEGAVHPDMLCAHGACICKGDDDCNDMYTGHCGGTSGAMCWDDSCACW